jgi:hypothetical protein
MIDVTADQSGGIPEGVKWCPHCNGYGSSLKEGPGRCNALRRQRAGLGRPRAASHRLQRRAFRAALPRGGWRMPPPGESGELTTRPGFSQDVVARRPQTGANRERDGRVSRGGPGQGVTTCA